MFDTYKIVKDLEKEGKFSEKQAASIVKAISGSVEVNLADITTKQDLAHLEEKMDLKFAAIEEKMDLKFCAIEEKMATKEDLAKILVEIEKNRVETEKNRVEIAQNHSSLLKWLMWVAVGMTTTVVSAMYYMIKYLPAIQAAIQNTPR